VSDARNAARAIEQDASLHKADADFQSFPGLRRLITRRASSAGACAGSTPVDKRRIEKRRSEQIVNRQC
jgi:hypothetical protein